MGSGCFPAVGIEAVLPEFPRESAWEEHFHGLLFVVFRAFVGHAVKALFRVELVAGFVPYVAQVVDVEHEGVGC